MVKQAQHNLYQCRSASALMNSIIDYAGIFPPTELPLDQAINNYSKYIRSDESWMIGPFVFPAARLEELEKYIHLFNREYPLTLSALISKAEHEGETITLLERDLEKIQSFQNKYPENIQVTALELPLYSSKITRQTLEIIVRISEKYNVVSYCEIPVHSETNDADFLDIALKISNANNSNNQLRAKLRTGSVKKELIPNVEIVASFIHACREHGVSMKFTAGLHHPIREYRQEVDGMMHGFLNVFCAGLMAHEHHLDKSMIIEILSDEDQMNFSLKDESLTWNHLNIEATDIERLRQYVCSFGSCNFVGPFTELVQLNIIEGGN